MQFKIKLGKTIKGKHVKHSNNASYMSKTRCCLDFSAVWERQIEFETSIPMFRHKQVQISWSY